MQLRKAKSSFTRLQAEDFYFVVFYLSTCQKNVIKLLDFLKKGHEKEESIINIKTKRVLFKKYSLPYLCINEIAIASHLSNSPLYSAVDHKLDKIIIISFLYKCTHNRHNICG